MNTIQQKRTGSAELRGDKISLPLASLPRHHQFKTADIEPLPTGPLILPNGNSQETSSHFRHNPLQAFASGLLFPLFDMTQSALAVGGHFWNSKSQLGFSKDTKISLVKLLALASIIACTSSKFIVAATILNAAAPVLMLAFGAMQLLGPRHTSRAEAWYVGRATASFLSGYIALKLPFSISPLSSLLFAAVLVSGLFPATKKEFSRF